MSDAARKELASPEANPGPSGEKGSGDASTKRCHCKYGKCRQLYCICRKRGISCDPAVCQCTDCLNDDREEAVRAREMQK